MSHFTQKIGIRSKFWPWLVSFMLATEPAMDNTLNCFNNYRSNLFSTQKLYTFDAKLNSIENYKKMFRRGWKSLIVKDNWEVQDGSIFEVFWSHRRTRVTLSYISIINTKTEGLYNVIVTP